MKRSRWRWLGLIYCCALLFPGCKSPEERAMDRMDRMMDKQIYMMERMQKSMERSADRMEKLNN